MGIADYISKDSTSLIQKKKLVAMMPKSALTVNFKNVVSEEAKE